jgi:hypothetical protein
MTKRGQIVAAGMFIAALGVGLIVWNWYDVTHGGGFGVKSALLGPVAAVYGVCHAIYAQDQVVVGSPRWSKIAFAIGLGLAVANWYGLCRVACATCSLSECI